MLHGVKAVFFLSELYSMFHETWTSFKFNRNQLGTVLAFIMISVPWSIQRAHQVISEKLLSKEFHCGTTYHKYKYWKSCWLKINIVLQITDEI